MSVTKKSQDTDTYPVPARFLESNFSPRPHIATLEAYREAHDQSLTDPAKFWTKHAKELLSWDKPFTKVLEGSFKEGEFSWFSDGELNACYNCVDRHAESSPEKVAIIYEADEPGNGSKVTYGELRDRVSQLSNLLVSYGLKKGDTVTIYLPMVPEAIVSLMACARLGIVHSLIFAGFSASALSERINTAESKVVITADEGKRGTKTIPLKRTLDEALSNSPVVEKVLVLKRTGAPGVEFNPKIDRWWHEEMSKQSTTCPLAHVGAEDPLFILFTSGSTGKPKGLIHSTGGYLTGAACSLKYLFDCHDGDVFCCTADIGWITGHTYLTYGPLALGLTTVMFESVPTYPDAARYWKMVEEHKVTQFYTSPTAIRSLRRLGDKWVQGSDLSTLRVIGSVGEPIDPETWLWYYEKVGRGRCAVVDTYWQTETGSIIISPIPGATPTKPGAASFPFFGIDTVILNPKTGEELHKGSCDTGVLAIRSPWPSMARSVLKDHKRFKETYLNAYPGYYFTGDGASRDKDGYIWIRGRVDDVINVSGHRISTSEIEAALLENPHVAEAAVVGVPDQLTGESVGAFITLKKEDPSIQHGQLTKELTQNIRSKIGSFATAKKMIYIDELPKTRSGKIIRRILRKVLAGEASPSKLGDLSSLSNPSVIDQLVSKAKL